MMKSLIVNKPEDPVKYLIDKLEKPESKSTLFLKRAQQQFYGLFWCVRDIYIQKDKTFLTAVSI